MALSDGTASHDLVWTGADGSRIVCMDSMGHVDERLSPSDVVVAGSHTAACAVELLLHLRLRGVVGHAAGPGLRAGGVSGLAVLDRAGVPGAAVDGDSAPIADGRAMYERGRVLLANDGAASLGVTAGMPVPEATLLMATGRLGPHAVRKIQHVVHTGQTGTVIALDTIGHADERIDGTVICMGSHSGTSMADYVERYRLHGTITNDAGDPPERSAVRGMDRLDERGIPAAVVDGTTAAVGDGRSTFDTGIVSQVNACAARLGIGPGTHAADAALRMLAAGVAHTGVSAPR
ncbi:hypothetical protein [Amycolatopsis antarctica]|nr:hypothetical protein [Amycolatopsis antarctica]